MERIRIVGVFDCFGFLYGVFEFVCIVWVIGLEFCFSRDVWRF